MDNAKNNGHGYYYKRSAETFETSSTKTANNIEKKIRHISACRPSHKTRISKGSTMIIKDILR
jgi:hypothetical protein